MNIFKEFGDILGLETVAPRAGALQEFFTLAGEIRVKLGGKAYLLDRYISYLLGAANEVLCEEAATDGFSAGREARMVCQDVAGGGHEQAEHPLHAKAKVYLNANPLPYQELITRSDILTVAMMDEYTTMAMKEYANEVGHKLMAVVDMIHVEQLFDDISGIIGDEAPMERLNLLLMERFLAVSACAAYAQGLTNDLLYCLIHRDMETSKQVFQLIMECGLLMEA